MAVLQRTIAKRLGVSQMTVSRALRGENGISEETRGKILEAARQAGLPLPPSPKLAADKALLHVICTIAADPAGPDGVSPFHARLLNGLRRGARECASEIMNCPEPAADWPLVVARGQVDGVVLVWGDEHTPLPSTPCPTPQVHIFHGPPHADVVTADNFSGGIQLGEHLAAMGHRRVAFIGPETQVARERLAGLRTALDAVGGACPRDIAQLKRGRGGQGPEAVDQLLAGQTCAADLQQRFTAIVCYNDWFAMHAIQRLNELGLRVPEDVSVTGFDNAEPAGYDGPKLTTCAVPIEELGAEAARLLYWRIEHPNAVRRKLSLETELAEGGTVARVEG
jgi:LacI family repressor for deo operon, udp, cdd, tsx, nupC, and nupG